MHLKVIYYSLSMSQFINYASEGEFIAPILVEQGGLCVRLPFLISSTNVILPFNIHSEPETLVYKQLCLNFRSLPKAEVDKLCYQGRISTCILPDIRVTLS
jgi:hypothetical protein